MKTIIRNREDALKLYSYMGCEELQLELKGCECTEVRRMSNGYLMETDCPIAAKDIEVELSIPLPQGFELVGLIVVVDRVVMVIGDGINYEFHMLTED